MIAKGGGGGFSAAFRYGRIGGRRKRKNTNYIAQVVLSVFVLYLIFLFYYYKGSDYQENTSLNQPGLRSGSIINNDNNNNSIDNRNNSNDMNNNNNINNNNNNNNNVFSHEAMHDGVIILGMHRSGTSMLGYLIKEMGFAVGNKNELIWGANCEKNSKVECDNKKGFWERVDFVVQNDIFMNSQKIGYSSMTHTYDSQKALKDYLMETIETKEGKSALNFVKKHTPWMQKDPRMAITLRTWLPLLPKLPAIIFSFRHPMETANSLYKREKMQIHRGLLLWYTYNRAAIRNSNDLCRVITSNFDLLRNPNDELERIYNELHTFCGMNIPKRVDEQVLHDFIDTSLQHTKHDDECNGGNGILPWKDAMSGHAITDSRGETVYIECMRLFCAMNDRSAFSSDFQFKEWGDAMQYTGLPL